MPDPPPPDAPSDPPPPLRLTLAELEARLAGFVREYLKSKSKETAGTYRRALNEFERYFAPRKEQFRFRVEDVEGYKRYLMEERELSQVSVSTYLTALRRFCQYLVDVGLLAENPALPVKGNRRPSDHSRRVLTEAEVGRLLEATGTATPIARRDRAIAHCMLYAGLAEIEIVRADVQDLEQTLLGWFLRVQGKGHTLKDQQVPMDPPAMDAIRLYLDARRRVRPEDPLFVSHGRRSDGERLNTRSVRTRINALLKEAGLKRPGVTPHSLAHTAALLWLNDGMPLEEVRRRMRHGTLDTTMIYFRQQGLLKGGAADPKAPDPPLRVGIPPPSAS
jgi:integrase/recombinase XerC